jgi:hypothetical protein
MQNKLIGESVEGNGYTVGLQRQHLASTDGITVAYTGEKGKRKRDLCEKGGILGDAVIFAIDSPLHGEGRPYISFR